MNNYYLFTQLEDSEKIDLIKREMEILKDLGRDHTIKDAVASLEKLKYGYDQKGNILFYYTANSFGRV